MQRRLSTFTLSCCCPHQVSFDDRPTYNRVCRRMKGSSKNRPGLQIRHPGSRYKLQATESQILRLPKPDTPNYQLPDPRHVNSRQDAATHVLFSDDCSRKYGDKNHNPNMYHHDRLPGYNRLACSTMALGPFRQPRRCV